MFEPAEFLIPIITIVLIAFTIWKRSRKYVVGTLAVIALILGLCAIQDVAKAEAHHGTVVIIYYDEDTFIVEDDNGRRDLYDDRGDLVPGDELLIDGDNIVLIQQSSWIWYDIYYEDDIAASFLYPEDAAEVMSHVKEVKNDG